MDVQNGAVLTDGGLMAKIDETRVAVRDINDRSRQRQSSQNIRSILNGTDVNWSNAGEHLATDIRLNGQRNFTEIEVASV